MNEIPVIAFAAYSGTGKTTLIEKLIISLKKRNLRLAVIKHDGHGFEIDHKGKDSWRFAEAGADITIVSSEEKTAYIERRKLTFEQVISMVTGVDLILVEGYKNEDVPKIGIAREDNGKGFTAQIDQFEAIVTDMKIETVVPCFELTDIEGIAEFILKRINRL